eukprot:2711434-Prymnesium_polylepis.1
MNTAGGEYSGGVREYSTQLNVFNASLDVKLSSLFRSVFVNNVKTEMEIGMRGASEGMLRILGSLGAGRSPPCSD